MKLFTSITIILIWLIMLTFSACTSEKIGDIANDEKKVYPVDSLMGDWQGTRQLSDGSKPLVAQVIAYRNGQYRINLMEKFDTSDSLLAELDGRKEGEKIIVSGSAHNVKWKGTIQGKTFLGEYVGAQSGSFIMNKIIRLSPLLGKEPPAGALVLFDGSDLSQWEHQREAVGYLSLTRHLGAVNQSSAYLKTSVWSDNEQPVILEMGSNDALKAWLNGKQIFARNVSRGAEPGQEKIEGRLKKGWNTILLRITNEKGEWGAFARLTDLQGSPVTTIAEKDSKSEDKKSSKNLKGNNWFLTVWQVSGPYTKEGLDAGALFEVAFAPENGKEDAVLWKAVDFTAVDYSPNWKIIDGSMEVLPSSRSLQTKKKFTDYQLHLEFRSPFMPNAKGQARGNSGVYNQGRYEVQVLDSYGLSGEDNECGGIYKIAKPLVNMCAPPMQWQSYDITFLAARFNPDGKKISDAMLTVIHNGVTIHQDLEIPVATGGAAGSGLKDPGPLMLQDHGDLVQYRNIWLVETTD